jgi:hypothetical protein
VDDEHAIGLLAFLIRDGPHAVAASAQFDQSRLAFRAAVCDIRESRRVGPPCSGRAKLATRTATFGQTFRLLFAV